MKKFAITGESGEPCNRWEELSVLEVSQTFKQQSLKYTQGLF
jgi:hypothetical protein